MPARQGTWCWCFQVIEMIGEFDVDVLGEKGSAMLAMAEKPTNNSEQIGAFFHASQGAIAEALSAGRHELASDLSHAVYRTCQQSKEFRKKALDQRDRVQAYCRRQAERQEAEGNLKANPDDADAHLALAVIAASMTTGRAACRISPRGAIATCNNLAAARSCIAHGACRADRASRCLVDIGQNASRRGPRSAPASRKLLVRPCALPS